MIKKYSLRKIGITTLLLILSFVLYHYPENLKQNINESINKVDVYTNYDNYLSMVKIDCIGKSIDDKIERIVKHIKNNGLLPSNTKLLSYEIINDLIIINFSSDFYDVSGDNERKLIESLVYSFTSIDSIKKIQILVDGKVLTTLPHSKEKLNEYLDRSFGINRIYNINSINNVDMITIYYYDSNSNYVPVSYYYNERDDKVTMIIEAMESNYFLSLKLSSYLNKGVKLMNYELLEDSIILNFNEFFNNYLSDGKVIEEVKYAIGYSMADSLNINKVEFMVNSHKIDELILAK